LDLYRGGVLVTRSVAPAGCENWAGSASAGRCNSRFLWTVPASLPAASGYSLTISSNGRSSAGFSVARPTCLLLTPKFANGMLDPLDCGRHYHTPYFPPPPPPPPPTPPPTPTPTYDPGDRAQRCMVMTDADASKSLACAEGAVISSKRLSEMASEEPSRPAVGAPDAPAPAMMHTAYVAEAAADGSIVTGSVTGNLNATFLLSFFFPVLFLVTI
jgi:hypothetical protein